MQCLYILSTIFISILAAPAVNKVPASTNNPYEFCFDTSSAVTSAQFKCLKKAGYTTMFTRCYNPSGSGSYDNTAGSNIRLAFETAHIYSQVYMTPVPLGLKTGAKQADEVMAGIRNQDLSASGIWIQVTSPSNWFIAPQSNINFINTVLNRFRQYGMIVGIYTNTYDWSQITGNYTGVGNDVLLWYWNVFGSGLNGETNPDFSDFRQFGSWMQPTAKQYGQVENICSVIANRDVYGINPNLAEASVLPMGVRPCEQEKPCEYKISPEA